MKMNPRTASSVSFHGMARTRRSNRDPDFVQGRDNRPLLIDGLGVDEELAPFAAGEGGPDEDLSAADGGQVLDRRRAGQRPAVRRGEQRVDQHPLARVHHGEQRAAVQGVDGVEVRRGCLVFVEALLRGDGNEASAQQGAQPVPRYELFGRESPGSGPVRHARRYTEPDAA